MNFGSDGGTDMEAPEGRMRTARVLEKGIGWIGR